MDFSVDRSENWIGNFEGKESRGQEEGLKFESLRIRKLEGVNREKKISGIFIVNSHARIQRTGLKGDFLILWSRFKPGYLVAKLKMLPNSYLLQSGREQSYT